MASKKLYENAAAHVEAGADEGSYVVVAADGDREVAYITPGEFGQEHDLARAVDFADLMARGTPPIGAMGVDEPAPRPQRRQAPVAETKPE